jgi:hypothetical protein
VKPVSYLTVSLLLLAFGPGLISIDALIKKRFGTPTQALGERAS